MGYMGNEKIKSDDNYAIGNKGMLKQETTDMTNSSDGDGEVRPSFRKRGMSCYLYMRLVVDSIKFAEYFHAIQETNQKQSCLKDPK